MKLSKRQRVLNTFNYGQLDRPAIYDVIHSVKFIEAVSGKTINPGNAEDAVCKAVAETLDMVRHFAIPHNLEITTVKDGDGFVYRKEWWTADIIERPFKTVTEAKEVVKKDIFKIRSAIEEKKFCRQAMYNIQLFEDRYNCPEELNAEFERIQEKLDGTVMVAPEQPDPCSYIQTRYNVDNFIYLFKDYPELMQDLIAAHLDYRFFIIDSFPQPPLTPVAFTGTFASGPAGLMFSPEFIYKTFFPSVKRILDRLKSKDYKVIYDFEGDSRQVLDQIVRQGADAYTPVEEISGVKIDEIKKKYPKLVLGFVIDSINLLTGGTTDDVIKKTMNTVNLAEEYGGIFIGSSAAIHEEVPVENALAMINTVKKIKF
ncbi:MAG: hypothetical protein FJW68_08460 [Actinobacteria bacterium]|nr:hypothetical protein [Actinomycetota bacterium]